MTPARPREADIHPNQPRPRRGRPSLRPRCHHAERRFRGGGGKGSVVEGHCGTSLHPHPDRGQQGVRRQSPLEERRAVASVLSKPVDLVTAHPSQPIDRIPAFKRDPNR